MTITDCRRVLKFSDLYTHMGKIDKIVGMTVEATGPSSNIGDVCRITQQDSDKEVLSEVVGFKENKVLLMPYNDMDGIGYGSSVMNTGEKLMVNVSDGLMGRTVDAMGNAIDGGEPIPEGRRYSINGEPSNPMDRPRIDTPIQMGIKAIDGFMTIGKGQRMGIFAGSGVGKSTLMGMLARNVKADINVIALVGERGREVVEFMTRDLGEEG
ncbi:MAG: flagellum-specific ATP synthase FliI, partial [Oscillospiraceae bacterium]